MKRNDPVVWGWVGQCVKGRAGPLQRATALGRGAMGTGRRARGAALRAALQCVSAASSAAEGSGTRCADPALPAVFNSAAVAYR